MVDKNFWVPPRQVETHIRKAQYAYQRGEKVEDPFVTYKDKVEEADFTLDYVKDKHQEI